MSANPLVTTVGQVEKRCFWYCRHPAVHKTACKTKALPSTKHHRCRLSPAKRGNKTFDSEHQWKFTLSNECSLGESGASPTTQAMIDFIEFSEYFVLLWFFVYLVGLVWEGVAGGQPVVTWVCQYVCSYVCMCSTKHQALPCHLLPFYLGTVPLSWMGSLHFSCAGWPGSSHDQSVSALKVEVRGSYSSIQPFL